MYDLLFAVGCVETTESSKLYVGIESKVNEMKHAHRQF